MVFIIWLCFFNELSQNNEPKGFNKFRIEVDGIEKEFISRVNKKPYSSLAKFELANFYFAMGQFPKAKPIVEKLSILLAFSNDLKLYVKVEMLKAELLIEENKQNEALIVYQNLSEIKLKCFRKLRELNFISKTLSEDIKSPKIKLDLRNLFRFSSSFNHFKLCLDVIDEASTLGDQFGIREFYSYYKKSVNKKVITFSANKSMLLKALNKGDSVILLNQYLDKRDHPVLVIGFDPQRDTFLIKDFALNSFRYWISSELIKDIPSVIVINKDKEYPELEKENKWNESVLLCISSEGKTKDKLKQLEDLCLNLQYNAVTSTARWELKEKLGMKDIQLMRVAQKLNFWSSEPEINLAQYYFNKKKYTLTTGWLVEAERKDVTNPEIKKLKLQLSLKGEKHFSVEELYSDYEKVKNSFPLKQRFDVAKNILVESGRSTQLNDFLIESLEKLEDKAYLYQALKMCLKYCYNPNLAMKYFKKIKSKAEVMEKKSLLAKQKQIEHTMKEDQILRGEKKYYELTDFENLGFIQVKKAVDVMFKKPREVKYFLNKASFYNPNDVRNIKNKAIIDFRLGEYEKAAKAFKYLYTEKEVVHYQRNWFNLMAVESFYRAGKTELAIKLFDVKGWETLGINIEKTQFKNITKPIFIRTPDLFTVNELMHYTIEKCGIKDFVFSGNLKKDFKQLNGYKEMLSGATYLTANQIKELLLSGFPVFKIDFFKQKLTAITGYDDNRQLFIKTMDSDSSLPVSHIDSTKKVPCMYFYNTKVKNKIKEIKHSEIITTLASLTLSHTFNKKMGPVEKRNYITTIEKSIDKKSDLFSEYLYQLAYMFLEEKSDIVFRLPFKKNDPKADWIKAITMMTLDPTKALPLNMITEKLNKEPFDSKIVSSAILYLQVQDDRKLSKEICKALRFVLIKNEYLILHMNAFAKYSTKINVEHQARIIMDHNLGLINKFKLAQVLFTKGSFDFTLFIIEYLEKKMVGSENEIAIKRLNEIKKQIENSLKNK